MITKLAGHFIIPAQYIGWKCQSQLNDLRQKLRDQYEGKEIDIAARDGIRLNAMFFKRSKSIFPWPQKKILIRFGGNGENYESLYEVMQEYSYIKKVHKLGYDVLLFNYRGVGKSKGSATPDGLAKDGQAVIDYALSQGYKEKNILIHGFSLGGAIATKALASNQACYQEIKFVNDRSFSSIKSVIENFSISRIYKWLLSFLLKISFWNFDAVKDWKELKNPKILSYSDFDDIIPFKGSLFHEVSKTENVKKVVLSQYCHNQELSSKDMKFLFSRV